MVKSKSGKNNILVTIMLGLLIASFALFGTGGGGLFGANTGWVAKVGETEVATADFDRMVQNMARQYQQQTGGQMTAVELIRNLRLDSQVLQYNMGNAAFAEAARRNGLRATVEQVAEDLQDYPAFQVGGSFNKGAMDSVLRSNGMTIRSFERQRARELTVQQLIDAVSAPRPENLVMASWLHAIDSERRTADLINISLADAGEIEPASEEDIQAHYDANKANYMSPERRSWNYVLLTPEVFAAGIEVAEEDIVAEFESNATQYSQPETREVLQVSFPSQVEAEVFKGDLEGGADFVTRAAELTDFAAEEISIGTYSKDNLARDFDQNAAEAVFALEAGGATDIIESFAGFVVYGVAVVNEGENKTLEDVRDEIRTGIANNRALDDMYAMRDTLEDELALEPSLALVAEKLGLTLASAADLDGSGRRADGSFAVTTRAERSIATQAFRAFEGDQVEVLEIDPSNMDSGLFAVELVGVTETAQRPLEEVTDQVRSEIERERRTLAAGEKAEEAIRLISEGMTAEEAIQTTGGTSLAARNVARTAASLDSGVAPNIRRLIFELGEGETSVEQSADGNGYIVVHLKEINRAEVDPDSFEAAARAGQLQATLAGELQQFYNAALLATYERSVNNPLIQQLYYRDQ